MRYWEGQKRAEPLPPANDEHLELVQQLDKVQWNEWRSSNPDVIPTLFNADLKGVDLSGYNLRKAKLDGANLTDAKLQGTNFGDASLSEAILYRANLDRANFAGANLQDADFQIARATEAIFSNANAHGARFAGAVLQDTQFGRSDLRDSDLREAKFHGSDLRQVRLEGAILWTTQFDESDLRGATGMLFDETIIRNTKFSPRSPDRWSTLRRHYTGPRYAITLIFLIAFVLPYFAKATGWVIAAQTQETISETVLETKSRLASLKESEAARSPVSISVIESIQDKLPSKSSPKWRQVHVWELLLGVDKGLWYFFSTCLLLLYNLFRGVLTFVVGPMRDAEERSGVSPPHRVEGTTSGEMFLNWLRGEWAESYAWLWIPHKVVTVLFVVAVSSFLFHTISWLSLVVWLPI